MTLWEIQYHFADIFVKRKKRGCTCDAPSVRLYRKPDYLPA
jgi:hypothetical protein